MAKKKRYYSGDYSGMDSRRRMEYEDSRMISEDRNAIANLPQQPMIKMYPQAPYYEGADLNDTIRGVDEQMWKDSHNKTYKKGGYPEKY